jgi:hypothetical protein
MLCTVALNATGIRNGNKSGICHRQTLCPSCALLLLMLSPIIMITPEVLKAKLADRKSALQKIDRDREKLDRDRERVLGEVSAFEELLLEHAEVERAKSAESASNKESPSDQTVAPAGSETPPRSTRGLSQDWKTILKKLSREDQFDYDAVVSTANRCGIELDKPGARSRLHAYITSGYVERIQEGVFRITQKGKEAAE